jgi:hypothetical protein
MKTFAALVVALFAATGCATSTSVEDSGSSADDMRAQNFGDVTAGGRAAVDLLGTKPQASMTIASAVKKKSWRFDTSAKGFVVTAIDEEGRDGLQTAFALDFEDGKATLAGIAVSHPYVSPEDVRTVMQQIKHDLDAVLANIPEVQDPGVPSDPSAWSPKEAADCDSKTKSVISMTMSAGVLLGFGGIVVTNSLVGAPVGVVAIAAGITLVVLGDAADSLLCGHSEMF